MSRVKLATPLIAFLLVLVTFNVINDRGAVAEPAPVVAPGPVRPGASTDERIAQLQAAVRAAPEGGPYAELGGAYLQRLRETGDPGFYARAEAALGEAMRRDARDVMAMIGMGQLELGRHRFDAALEWGRRARRMAPEVLSSYPVVVDALVELGRYDEAAITLQQLLDRRPGLPAYARASYLRELRGDLEGATEAMRLAVAAGGQAPENVAYVQTLLGDLQFTDGRTEAARDAYRLALARVPRYAPALAGLARAEAASGRPDRAIRRLREVVERLPLPEYVISLGELELAAGRDASAEETFALVRVQQRLLDAAGVNTDVEMALFEADFGDPERGVALARRAWEAAPGVRSADAMGWALTRAGRPEEGDVYGRRALKLGWKDPLVLYHAAISAREAGRQDAARTLLRRALGGNPRFSALFAPRARRALQELT